MKLTCTKNTYATASTNVFEAAKMCKHIKGKHTLVFKCNFLKRIPKNSCAHNTTTQRRRKNFLCLKFVDNNPVIHFHYHDMLYTTLHTTHLLRKNIRIKMYWVIVLYYYVVIMYFNSVLLSIY